MKTSDFNYTLPNELIAQSPIEPRDSSRLMVLHRGRGTIEHRTFSDITEYLESGDVLVLNDSRVIPARINGRKRGSGGRVEMLLLHRAAPHTWEALVKPAKRVKTGAIIQLGDKEDASQTAEVLEERDGGIRVIHFQNEEALTGLGHTPLPPYIHKPLEDPERYQTVYAAAAGSSAAPTAGLHFTPRLIKRIQAKGVKLVFVTLHVGLDTFMPVRSDDPTQHHIHREYGILDSEAAREITRAREEGRRVICVGTTTVRIMETAARENSPHIDPIKGWIDLFILPGHHFRAVDAMITNFHLPKTTLLMLVSAFAGKEMIAKAYAEAITHKYRFYSFGDAMLIL